MNQRVIGIDVGGTKIASALVSQEGKCEELHRVATPIGQGASAILSTIREQVKILLKTATTKGHEVIAVGIGTAGQVNYNTGVITYAVGTLPDWAGTTLTQQLHASFALPTIADNDVNALAMAELQFGAAQTLNSILCVAVGTGIGGAVILDRQLWRGFHWSAGEIGHIVVDWQGVRMCNCGQRGHLEAYSSGPAMANEYHQRRGLSKSNDLYAIAAAARSGDPVAREVIEEGARILGGALAGLINVIDPEGVIIGGGVAELDAIWWNALEIALRANPLPGPRSVQLLRAQLGVNAVVIGAGALAWNQIQV
jgi:glucokinase